MFNLLIKSLKKTINSLEDDLINRDNEIMKQKFEIKTLKDEQQILLINAQELREKITDLENNLELVVNELTPKKREKLGL